MTLAIQLVQLIPGEIHSVPHVSCDVGIICSQRDIAHVS